tara:strand:- start:5599 stop:6855 length:1257 start_codon:yes stop_codon:yes gene_type:complete
MSILNQLTKIINQLFGYGFSQLVVILLPIILLPILTRTLTIVEFADYSIYKTVLALSTPLISFSLSTYLLKNFYSILKNEVNKFLINSSFYSLFITIIFIIISYILSNPIQEILKIDDFGVLMYAFVNTFLFAIHTLFLTVYRANSNIKQFFITNFIVVLITILGVLLISYFEYINLRLVLLTHSVSYLISILLGLLFFIKIKKDDISFDQTLIKNFIQFSIPLVLYSVFTQLYTGTDRMIINFFLSKSDLAIYAATFQIAFGVSAMGSVLQLAWTPYLFKKMSNTNKIDFQTIQIIASIIVFMIFFSLAYYLLFPTLMKIFLPEQYFGGSNIFIWFIMAGFVQVLYWIINPFLIIYEKRSYLLYIAIVAASINIVLNLIFTKNGIEYAAIIYFTTWIIQCLGSIICVYYAKKNLPTT